MSAATPERIEFGPRRNVVFQGLSASANVVFFGHNLGVECQRCGAYEQSDNGHRYCAHVSCPIALLELKRRKRKRTSNLERVYAPRFTRTGPPPASDAP